MLTIGIQISYERQPWNIKARIDNIGSLLGI